ncbi:hypothetical protein AALP_AA3G318800 [Arabis alpina]|uniref:Uncharacterized protein n=1 Tax=Arabis alpina TaxID=50452 RepID=A0A087HD12_ARAAL|nr:hypothetical protein AALP_AA3G318800 [Arabis alpina]
MEEHESISDFSSKLKSLSQEAVTLGKRYNDTKLVKKFLRCLPAKFMAYKSALNVSHNTEELSFGEVVGMLHAHEMELETATGDITPGEGILLEYDDEDPLECVNNQKQSKRSCMHTDSEEDSEDEEELSNFVAFLSITEYDEGEELSESESDGEHEDDLIKCYKEVCETLIRLGRENMLLIQEKRHLEALVESIQVELQAEKKLSQESVLLIKEKLKLATKADLLQKELDVEKEVSEQLQAQLDLQYKKIHMFAGTKQLDKILLLNSTEHKTQSTTVQRQSTVERHGTVQRQSTMKRHGTVQKQGCYFYGKHGHIKKFCYKFWNKIKKLRQQGKFFWNGWRSQIWVKKEDLLSTVSKRAPVTKTELNLQCNLACVSEERENTGMWHFESGNSRHMTRDMSKLQNLNNVKGVEVTFRDIDHGVLQHKGGDKVRCGSNYKEKHVKDQQKKVHGIESKSVLNGTKKVACSKEKSGLNDQSSPKEQSGSAEQSGSERAVVQTTRGVKLNFKEMIRLATSLVEALEGQVMTKL